MIRFYLRLALIPLALITAVLLVIRSQPYDDHELREILLPTDCPAPCFMGIRPGVTTVDEAVKLLEASGWVEGIDYQFSEFGLIIWDWNNQSPYQWTKEQSAGIGITDDYVDSVVLNTAFYLGEIRLILGTPDTEFVNADVSQTQQLANYWGGYNQYGIVILGTQSCSAMQPFRQKVTITIRQKSDVATNTNRSSGDSLYDVLHIC